MHWLRLYVINKISNGGAVHLAMLNGEIFRARINGSSLKVYSNDLATV